MDDHFNHAPNDSPRSGTNKKVAPMVLGAVTCILVLVVIWLVMKA